jgi:hypothetical protein
LWSSLQWHENGTRTHLSMSATSGSASVNASAAAISGSCDDSFSLIRSSMRIIGWCGTPCAARRASTSSWSTSASARLIEAYENGASASSANALASAASAAAVARASSVSTASVTAVARPRVG